MVKGKEGAREGEVDGLKEGGREGGRVGGREGERKRKPGGRLDEVGAGCRRGKALNGQGAEK